MLESSKKVWKRSVGTTGGQCFLATCRLIKNQPDGANSGPAADNASHTAAQSSIIPAVRGE